MTIRTLGLAGTAALFALPAFAQDVTGTWSATVEGQQGPIELVFDLEAEGNEVTGTVAAGQMPATEISDGRIDGSEISFTLSVAGGPGGGSMTIDYEGTVMDDAIEFESSFSGGPGGEPMVTEFTATRAE